MKKQLHCRLFTIALLFWGAAQSTVFAHHVINTDQNPVAGGFSLPMHGMDHVLAIVAVGLWATLLAPKAQFSALGSFLALALGGAALGMFRQIEFPLLEQGILLSVFAFGILLALLAKLPAWSVAIICGFFAIFHGYACGAELPAEWSGFSFGLGLFAATVVLVGGGYAIGRFLQRLGDRSVRIAGSAVALTAVYLWVR